MPITWLNTGTSNKNIKFLNTGQAGGIYTTLTPYTFSNLFTSAGATGVSGPSLAQAQTAYAGQPFLASNFTVTSGIQIFTLIGGGTYRITAIGAGGGAKGTVATGGKGVSMRGDFTFSARDVITMLVGQKGGDVGDGGAGTGQGGGGGASYVLKNGVLILAAGGGGGGTSYSGAGNGLDASTGTSGVSSGGYSGGTNGSGGTTSENILAGNGGGGYTGAGGTSGGYGSPGSAYTSGGAGGNGYQGGAGGFGGGGGGSFCAGGGGGGYSGGAGGYYSAAGGGGGGSYNLGSNQLNSVMATNTTGSILLVTL
jgi:hypothetical protein